MSGTSVDRGDEDAIFYIEGPDERGCVWVHGASSADPWARNLGPQERVVEVLSQWLAAIDAPQVKGRRLAAVEDEKRQAKRSRKMARPKDHRDEGGQG